MKHMQPKSHLLSADRHLPPCSWWPFTVKSPPMSAAIKIAVLSKFFTENGLIFESVRVRIATVPKNWEKHLRFREIFAQI